MIAKRIEQTNNLIELWDTQTMQDIAGNSVQIPRLIGRFSIEQLESQKAAIQEKIDAIKALA